MLDLIQRYANGDRKNVGLSETNIIWGTSINPQMESGTLEPVSYTHLAVELLADRETLAAMSRNLEALARPDAAEDIVNEIVKVMK